MQAPQQRLQTRPYDAQEARGVRHGRRQALREQAEVKSSGRSPACPLFQLVSLGARTSETMIQQRRRTIHDPLYITSARYKKLRVRRLVDISHKKFPCPNCPSVFVWKCTLKRHLRNECGKEPKFNCPYCDYRGKWKANVIRHIKRVHKDCNIYVYNSSFQKLWPFSKIGMPARRPHENVYVCPNPNCAKSFSWKGNLNRHLRYECGLQPRFKCPYCEYRCKVKGDVNKHIIRKHPGFALYVVDLFLS
ncbi:uncharacterized protein LOC117224668 [Megalopta genalis]|uniref:uncharacterized protein LOC117224668 n=1 Tax=Megalopta genalis TaxID=115081 RepID=UPI003FD5C202